MRKYGIYNDLGNNKDLYVCVSFIQVFSNEKLNCSNWIGWRRCFCSLFDTGCNFLDLQTFATLRYFPLRGIFWSDIFDCKEFSTQRQSWPWLHFFPPPDIFHHGAFSTQVLFCAEWHFQLQFLGSRSITSHWNMKKLKKNYHTISQIE